MTSTDQEMPRGKAKSERNPLWLVAAGALVGFILVTGVTLAVYLQTGSTACIVTCSELPPEEQNPNPVAFSATVGATWVLSSLVILAMVSHDALSSRWKRGRLRA